MLVLIKIEGAYGNCMMRVVRRGLGGVIFGP